MTPSKMKQWTVTSAEKDLDGLEYGEVDVPKVGDNDVLVKIGGASLNYRDLIIPRVSLECRRSVDPAPFSSPKPRHDG